MVKVDEGIDALVAAGVRLGAGVLAERERGDVLCAFIDAIGAADDQQVVCSPEAMKKVRVVFEALPLRPSSDLRARVQETLLRVEHRSATVAA